MTGNKRFRYNVNKNSIEYNNSHFAFLNGEESKIVKKLNELMLKKSDTITNLETEIMKLQKENKELKSDIDYWKTIAEKKDDL